MAVGLKFWPAARWPYQDNPFNSIAEPPALEFSNDSA
jgi:hypothetical protein